MDRAEHAWGLLPRCPRFLILPHTFISIGYYFPICYFVALLTCIVTLLPVAPRQRYILSSVRFGVHLEGINKPDPPMRESVVIHRSNSPVILHH